jgi:hypothetical protein
MPLHDWTRVPAGLFHHFHQDWSIEIARTLNRGRLPRGFSALVEQRAGPRESDVLTIETHSSSEGDDVGGVAMEGRPRTSIVRRTTSSLYAGRANRILVRHHLGRIVAVIEIISPGNKDSRHSVREFVDKTLEFLLNGIHVLIIDLFPPTARDPHGIHKAIWDELVEEAFSFPPGKDRILVSYETGLERTAYVEPVAPGDVIPDMPLFLTNDVHVLLPLEATYQETWRSSPEELRLAVETGVVPELDTD